MMNQEVSEDILFTRNWWRLCGELDLNEGYVSDSTESAIWDVSLGMLA
jgi:hypothetical protein